MGRKAKAKKAASWKVSFNAPHWYFVCVHGPSDRFYYRAMHYSAKRDLTIAFRLSVRPSVRQSVTLVDHDHIG